MRIKSSLFISLVFLIGCGDGANFSAATSESSDKSEIETENAVAQEGPSEELPVAGTADSQVEDAGGDEDGTPITISVDSSGSGDAAATEPNSESDTDSSEVAIEVTNDADQDPSSQLETSTDSDSPLAVASDTDESTDKPAEYVSTDDASDRAVGNACAAAFGVKAEKVAVAGNKSKETISLDSSTILAIRVTGNQPKVNITSPSESASIGGVCIFVAGNQATVDLSIGVEVESLVYRGTGNRSTGKIVVSENGSIAEILATLTGNQSTLSVSGAGTYHCGTPVLKGNKTAYNCQ